MSGELKKFSILITTKNRLEDLVFTLDKIKHLIARDDLECRVYDDGSIDGTSKYIKDYLPEIILRSNPVSKGYLYCRNMMLNETQAQFAISLDDDAHFVTDDPLEKIVDYFSENPLAGLLAFRIHWSKKGTQSTITHDTALRVKSFVGCAHVWRMKAWRDIPNYPEWFVFYGEEDFASYQLFKNRWEIHYLPQVLVNHRVDIKSRKNDADYGIRLRRSLRSGWYLYFLFYPLHLIPRKMLYSVWMQFRLKIFKGDFRALQAVFLAAADVISSVPKIIKNRNSLSSEEYRNYQKLGETRIYWNPEKVS
jgi:GT2 family glycosyltransferase